MYLMSIIIYVIYLLQFRKHSHKDNIKWFTETTFNQAITKAIFKEIEYYNKSIIEKHKADSINIDGFEYYNKNIRGFPLILTLEDFRS